MINLAKKLHNIEEARSKSRQRMHTLAQEAEAGGAVMVTGKEGDMSSVQYEHIYREK